MPPKNNADSGGEECDTREVCPEKTKRDPLGNDAGNEASELEVHYAGIEHQQGHQQLSEPRQPVCPVSALAHGPPRIGLGFPNGSTVLIRAAPTVDANLTLGMLGRAIFFQLLGPFEHL